MTSQIGTIFSEFIGNERNFYEGHDNNKVAFSLQQVARYLRFVDIIHSRYVEVNESYIQMNSSFFGNLNNKQSGSRELTADEQDQFLKHAELTEQLHLEIESFFIFTKIVLDKIAHFIQDYFGTAYRKKLKLKSHKKWCEVADSFARIKGMHLPEQIIPTMNWLQTHVAKHRDENIIHLQKSRTLFFTQNSPVAGSRIGTTQLYPKDSDKQSQSPNVDEVVTKLDAYIQHLMDLIVSNRDKSRYKIRSS